MECTLDGLDSFAQRNALEACAVIKAVQLYTFDTARNINLLQAGATLESSPIDSGHALRDDDVAKGDAVVEFVIDGTDRGRNLKRFSVPLGKADYLGLLLVIDDAVHRSEFLIRFVHINRTESRTAGRDPGQISDAGWN